MVHRLASPFPLPSHEVEHEPAAPKRCHHEPAPAVGGIRLLMARPTQGNQPVEIEVGSPLGALQDMVDPGRA